MFNFVFDNIYLFLFFELLLVIIFYLKFNGFVFDKWLVFIYLFFANFFIRSPKSFYNLISVSFFAITDGQYVPDINENILTLKDELSEYAFEYLYNETSPYIYEAVEVHNSFGTNFTSYPELNNGTRRILNWMSPIIDKNRSSLTIPDFYIFVFDKSSYLVNKSSGFIYKVYKPFEIIVIDPELTSLGVPNINLIPVFSVDW